MSKYKQIESEPTLSNLENIILQNLETRGHISLFYAALLTHDEESTADKLDAWRSDIQEEIKVADWEAACLKAQKQSISTRMKLLQYKWLMRTYITLFRWKGYSFSLCMGLSKITSVLEVSHADSVKDCWSKHTC